MGKFEDSWKEVFGRAEVSPADSVWSKIDHDLANADTFDLKRRVVLYQRVAAVSILFALLAGSFGFYRWRVDNSKFTQQKSVEHNPFTKKKEKSHNREKVVGDLKMEKETNSRTENIVEPKVTHVSGKPVLPHHPSDNNLIASNPRRSDSSKLERKSIASNDQLVDSKNNETHDLQLVSAPSMKKLFHYDDTAVPGLDLLPTKRLQGEPVIAELARKLTVLSPDLIITRQDKSMHEKLWASFTVSSGRFSSNANPYSNSQAYATYGPSSSVQTPLNLSTAKGTFYSVGMLGGARIARHWVLQAGFLYLNQSIGALSTINSSGSLSAVASYVANPAANVITSASPYTVISTNEFVSVPVFVGYLFIDKKIGLQLNAGAAADFFIRNTLSDPKGQQQSYSQGAGKNSPYRSVDMVGLMSSELSYRFGSRYRFSLVPGLRYSFNPALKSTTEQTNKPWWWDIGFRVRYILK